jgi:hypothetical protein
MTQERRRYGFVLERQCSLAKHYLAYHSQGSSVLQRHLEDWQEVAQTREFLPDTVEAMFTNRLRVSIGHCSTTKRRRGKCVGEMVDLEQSSALSGIH